MKKNNSYIYCILLFFMAQTNISLCQKNPCITAVTGNNDKVNLIWLRDSGSAVIQKFTPTCNGSLSSFSFNYRVLENINSGVILPVNTSGYPYFEVDLTIYELATGQSIDKTPTSSLSQVFTKPNIQVPIIKPNPREDFAYFTIPMPTTPEIKLLSAKQYCFVIQLNTAFCNDLITKKRTKLGSSYTPPVIGGEASLNTLLQKNICNIELATRLSYDNYLLQKDIHFIRTNTNETSGPMMMYLNETTNYQGYEMKWEKSSDESLVFAVTVIPFLPDIVGSNILCPNSTIFLTNPQSGGTWTIDNSSIVTKENWPDGSVRLAPNPYSGNKGLVKVSYTLNGNTTSKLIRVVNEDKPTISVGTNIVGTDCQNTSIKLTGDAVNNQALQLDGKSWAEMPNHPALGLTNKFTLEAWVSCTNPTAPQQIICKGEYDQEMGHYSLILFDNKIQFGFQTQPGYIIKHPIEFKPGEWHHVAGSYDGTTMRLYIDGVLVATQEAQATMIPNSGKLYIGQIGNNLWYFTYRMVGQIDEVRIWNVCRSSQEIKDNMNRTVSANNTGLVGYYKFNEPTSADPRLIKDYSSSQNDGYLFSSYFNGVIKLENCSAKKVPASIKFGDFSYHWLNSTTPSSPVIETVEPNKGYIYTVTDSATGCQAKSEVTWINMNTNNTININIPNDSRMPYLYQENGIIKLTFKAEDFITTNGTTSAKKTMQRSINNSNCTNNVTVIVTKSNCPLNKSIDEFGGGGKNLSKILVCNNSFPFELELRGFVDRAGNPRADDPRWEITSTDNIYTYELSHNHTDLTRKEFQKLKISTKESGSTTNSTGKATITYTYKYDGKYDCILTSDITVKPVTINISQPASIAVNNSFIATPTGGTWNSGNRNIIALDFNGKITSKNSGTTDIQYRVKMIDNDACFNQVLNTIPITIP